MILSDALPRRLLQFVCVLLALVSSPHVVASAPRQTTSTPYSGVPAPIPGVIQAVNFDNGGSSIAYFDTTPGNTGGAYRSTDVDLQASAGGGFNVGWTAPSEWLNYTVNVGTSGPYVVQLRVAATASGNSIHVGFNGPCRGVVPRVDSGDRRVADVDDGERAGDARRRRAADDGAVRHGRHQSGSDQYHCVEPDGAAAVASACGSPTAPAPSGSSRSPPSGSSRGRGIPRCPRSTSSTTSATSR